MVAVQRKSKSGVHQAKVRAEVGAKIQKSGIEMEWCFSLHEILLTAF